MFIGLAELRASNETSPSYKGILLVESQLLLRHYAMLWRLAVLCLLRYYRA